MHALKRMENCLNLNQNFKFNRQLTDRQTRNEKEKNNRDRNRQSERELTFESWIGCWFTFLTPVVYMVYQLSRFECLEQAKNSENLKFHNSSTIQW